MMITTVRIWHGMAWKDSDDGIDNLSVERESRS
jgi:hypothetical protein